MLYRGFLLKRLYYRFGISKKTFFNNLILYLRADLGTLTNGTESSFLFLFIIFVCQHLPIKDLLSDGIRRCRNPDEKKEFWGSFNLDNSMLSRDDHVTKIPEEKAENEKPCLWIVSQTPDLDPSRFLVQWLAASLNDIPLVMYQTR